MDLYEIRKLLNNNVNLSGIKLRVTYYSRVSTDNFLQLNSLKNQSEYFDEYIKTNDLWEYIPGYIDEGISGTTDYKRDNFMKMIEDAKKGKFDLIITKEISRFSRNTLDSIKYTRMLLEYGVGVWFLNDNINTLLQESELRLTIMASMAQDEIRRLSSRVKFGMKRSIKNGNILGNNMLYGYRKDKENGNLIINLEESLIVKRLYTYYAVDNYSLNKIANIFNNENIKTNQNKKWCTSTLSRMIRNPKYKGYYCGNKTEVIDYMTKKIKYISKEDWILYKDNIKIPPIVDEELWQRANKRIEKRNKSFGNSYKDKTIYKDRFLLSAKIYCASDNYLFHRRKTKEDISWICSCYLTKGKKHCDSLLLKQSELYYILNDYFNMLNIDSKKVIELLISLYKDNSTNTYNSELLKEKDKLINKKNKLLELFTEGLISNDEYLKMRNEYNAKIDNINGLINKNITDLNELDIYNFVKKNKVKYVEEIMKKLLNKIVVYKKNNNSIKLNIYINLKNNSFNKEYIFYRKYSKLKKVKYNVFFITK